MTDQPLLLTPEQAAELLQVGRTVMFALLDTGEVESVKIGRLRRIPRDAVTTYVDRIRREQSQPATDRPLPDVRAVSR